MKTKLITTLLAIVLATSCTKSDDYDTYVYSRWTNKTDDVVNVIYFNSDTHCQINSVVYSYIVRGNTINFHSQYDTKRGDIVSSTQMVVDSIVYKRINPIITLNDRVYETQVNL